MKLRFFPAISINFLLVILISCSNPKEEFATMLIYGGTIYTVDSTKTNVEAVAIRDNKIIFTGSLSEAEQSRFNEHNKLSSYC